MSAVSVVVPVFRNAGTLAELHRRVADALGEDLSQLVFVDDASPDDSAAVIDALAAGDPRVERVSLDANAGQHRAVLHGLDRARAQRVVVMDADLQDPPEAIPALLARADTADVVFGARRGAYEPRRRLLTSRLFKALLAAGCGVPRDAGMFFVANRRATDALLGMEGPSPYVVAMIGRAGLRIASVPVERAPRHDGVSAYDDAARLRSAARGLRWALVRAPPQRVAGREGHNEIQRRYYQDPSRKPGMLPRPSRYLERQVDEMIARTGLRPGDRVLDVGAGMGRYTLPLADRGLAVEAIDLSPELLAVLRERAGDRDIPTHHADVVDLVGSHAGAFDAVIGFFVLHHMHDVPGSIQAMAKLLRPEGRLGFLEPNPYNPLYYVQMAVRPSMTWEGDGGIVRMRRRPLVAAVRDAGLLDARLERFGMFPPQVADHRGALPVERLIERVAPLRPVLAFQVLTGRAP